MTIFDITNSKEYFLGNRDYYNSLAVNSVELLDELLLIVDTQDSLKELEYRYVNLLALLRFIDIEREYLDQVVSSFDGNSGDIMPITFLMHLKNYLLHVDSFIDYLGYFTSTLYQYTGFDYRFDRKAIPAYSLINETRNQIHHISLPTIDYNYSPIAPVHGDFGGRLGGEVHGMLIRWPLSDRFTQSIELSTLLSDSSNAIKSNFEGMIKDLLQKKLME